MILKKTFIFAFLLFICSISAQTKVASIFNNNMVLQQNSEVAIWGTDAPNRQIIVKANWGESKTIKTDNNGKWKIFIKTTKAGGPYKIEIKGSESISLTNVLLGEVWLCSGQSNMEMPIKGFAGQPINGSNDAVLKSKNPNIRLFNVKKSFSETPLDSVVGIWEEANPTSVSNFSAVAYFYGKILHENLQVPIGLINSSFGGTRVEAWSEETSLKTKQIELGIEEKKVVTLEKNSPSGLFNAMISPLIPYTIKGVIWYQGESNRNNANQYSALFKNMINDWREKWNIGEFPFYFVQIAPFEYGKKQEAAFLREAQLNAYQTSKNTGMAVTLDVGDVTFIHPPEKEIVSKRLALWALSKNYGFEEVSYSGPIYKSIVIDQDKITVNFTEAQNGVTSFGKELTNFTIAGADKVFYPAKAIIERGKLSVFSENVKNPVAVRYGWENFFNGTLFNLAGLPASSFRSDNWDN